MGHIKISDTAIYALAAYTTSHGELSEDYDSFSRNNYRTDEFLVFATKMLGATDLDVKRDYGTQRFAAFMSEAMDTWYRWARWAQYGLNVFDLTHSLAAGLVITDPGPIDLDELNFPFPSFCLQIQPGVVPVFIGDGKYEWATQIWVNRYRHAWTITDTPGPVEDCLFLGALAPCGLQTWRARSTKEFDEGPLEYEVVNRLRPEDPPLTPEDDLTISAAFRLVRNFCHWMEATGGQEGRRTNIAPGTKHNPNKKKPRLKVWFMGSEIKLSREVREAASMAVLGKATSREDWRLKVRFIVRGHWRNQVHGPARSLRRRQWIQPFWKGPEGQESWTHLYKTA